MLRKLFYHQGDVSTGYKRLLLLSGSVSVLTSMEYAISTHCILNTISDSVVTNSVAMNFLTKDMVGQVGGLLLLSKLKTWSSGGVLLSSCVLIQTGMVCDVMVMTSPDYLIPLTVTSTIMKNVAFTLISSINIRVLNRVVEKESIGEAYIGYSALSTVSSSLGMAIGLGLVQCDVWLLVIGVGGLLRYKLLKKIEVLGQEKE